MSATYRQSGQWVSLLPGLLLSLALLSGSVVADEIPSLEVRAESTTREIDYTLGSIARQHIMLHVPPGFELDASSLPAPAQNEAIELRDAHWETKDSAHERLIMLDIDWQIFVAGDTVKTMPLKKLHLEFKRDQQRLTVDVPPDKVIVSSLLPARIDAEHVKLYPDAPLPEWSLASQLWSLAGWLCLLALGVLYLLWFFGWIQLPQEKRMPFRQAWRAIQRLRENNHESRLLAMRLISRAMDQFAGIAVTTENLSRLLTLHPEMDAYSGKLRQFYQVVQQSFFGGQPSALSLEELRQLARQLSHMEIS